MATSTLGNGTLVLAGTTSGTTTVTATAVAGTTTLTLPAATDTLVGKATTDTLTNKTLTSPTISGVATFAAGSAAAPAITTTGDTNTGIFFPAADTIAFAEGGAEAMRLDSSGNLLVGTTSAPTGGAVSTWQNAGSSRWSMGPNGGSAFVVFNTSNVGVYVVDGQTGWTGTSDGTLKNVIAPITNGLSSISALKPTIYSWKSDEANTPYAGLIAQEVQSVFPSLVNDNNGTLGVNYTGVIPYLISAIQEQQALITQLTARITALESA